MGRGGTAVLPGGASSKLHRVADRPRHRLTAVRRERQNTRHTSATLAAKQARAVAVNQTGRAYR